MPQLVALCRTNHHSNVSTYVHVRQSNTSAIDTAISVRERKSDIVPYLHDGQSYAQAKCSTIG